MPARFRDPDGRWVGTSGRSRVVAYNTDALTEDEVPDSVFDLTDPKWKGKIGIAPTNASFQAFVTAMRLTLGEERTREWLEGIKANEPKLYEKNTPIVEAVASGEIELGLVNHYYLYLVKEESPDAPVANHFLAGGDPGALVNVAGAAILETRRARGRRASSSSSSCSPTRASASTSTRPRRPSTRSSTGIEPRAGLPPLDELARAATIELDELGAELEKTLELLNEVGFTT